MYKGPYIDLRNAVQQGGVEGLKLQLTMRSQGDLFTHITLNKKELKKLVKEIQTNFDL